MRKFISILFVLIVLNAINAEADYSIQKVEVVPLTGGVSFNTVIANPGWVTCPSVSMVGRKEISILNTSTTQPVFLTSVSGSTASRWLYPREEIFFKAASSLNIYVSADTAVSVQVTEIR